MNYQFNLFGFQIQVSRFPRYIVEVYPVDEVVHPSEWYWCSESSYLVAVFRGWKRARDLAFAFNQPAEYLVYYVLDDGEADLVRCRTIGVRTTVDLFSR